jgi:hypothetical protein
MTDEVRDCPDCGLRNEFTQVHSAAGRCPDAADGQCPEWYCAGCGAGVLISPLPLLPASMRLGRVA